VTRSGHGADAIRLLGEPQPIVLATHLGQAANQDDCCQQHADADEQRPHRSACLRDREVHVAGEDARHEGDHADRHEQRPQTFDRPGWSSRTAAG
jgi:hypothetical protein